MRDDNAYVFPDNATYGYAKESGEWAINDLDSDMPKEYSAQAFNAFTVSMIERFVEAFTFLGRVSRLYINAAYIDNSDLRFVKDGERIIASSNTLASFIEALNFSLQDYPGCYITDVSIFCDTHVYIPNPEGGLEAMWIPGTGYFHFGYLLPPGDKCIEDALPFTGCSAQFEVSLDVWVSTTYGHDKGRIDNQLVASHNQPLLENSLKEWEKLVGKPIDEWSSTRYPDQIFRYGFKQRKVLSKE